MRNYFFILFLFIARYGLAQNYSPSSTHEIVKHTYYTLGYDEGHEQAAWVCYTLTPTLLAVETKRTNDFREDSAISTGSASLADYRRSGYDRGHLCPAADMVRSPGAMSESFLMSNMSPQHPSFNRGGWKRLEEFVREVAKKSSITYVVTGPVLSEALGSIGKNEVTIPAHYYKVFYQPEEDCMVAFVMPNEKIMQRDLMLYVVSVDSVEVLTGIDFFAELPDSLESSLESVVYDKF